jgi:hypothetical protein
LFGLVLVVFVGRSVLGFIDATFTPIDLAHQSDVILYGAIKAGGKADEFTMGKAKVLKGKMPAKALFTLAQCNKDQKEDVAKVMKSAGETPILLFYGTYQEEKLGFLHIDGKWFTIKEKGGAWSVQGFNAKMSGTYAGGTDMLMRMSDYILKSAEPTVPVTVGTRWMDTKKLGAIKGEVTGMASVQIKGDKKNYLFVASREGDVIYMPKEDEEFEEATKAVKLDTKSSRFVWADISGDGLPDLVTWDGTTIQLRETKAGVLQPADAKKGFKLEEECLGLCPVSAKADGKPGILVSSDMVPFILSYEGQAWKKVDLPKGAASENTWGEATAAVVADLNNDGFADVLQPRASKGVIWKGKAGGFEAPVESPVASGGGVAQVAVGDYDENGFLDFFVSGSQSNQVWEADGKFGFKGVISQAGSLSYKTPAGVSVCLNADLNQDGRADLALCYRDKDFTYHFNRGFRCLGEEGELKLTGLEDEQGAGGPGGAIGQKAAAIADFNGDASQDLALVLTNGNLYCFFNDLFEVPGLMVRLKKGTTGPVTVTVWQGEKAYQSCVGAGVVYGHNPGTHITLRNPGKVTVKWAAPGQKGKSKVIDAKNEMMEVVLE